MAKFNLTLPKMGESVDEATIVSWLKNVGDEVLADDFVVEIATDKVDSEVPSSVEGILIEKKFKENDVVKVKISRFGFKDLPKASLIFFFIVFISYTFYPSVFL